MSRKALVRACNVLQQRLGQRALCAWRRAVQESWRHRRSTQKLDEYSRERIARATLQVWRCASTEGQQTQADQQQAHLATLGHLFDVWRCVVKLQAAASARAVALLTRMTYRRTLHGSLRSWKLLATMARHRQVAVRLYESRQARKLLHHCLEGWASIRAHLRRGRTAAQAKMQHCLTGMLHRHSIPLLSLPFWRLWCLLVAYLLSIHDFCLSSAGALHSAFRTWSSAAHSQRHRQMLLDSAMSTRTRTVMSMCWALWRGHVRWCARVRELCLRHRHRCLTSAFQSWATVAAAAGQERALLRRCMTAWQAVRCARHHSPQRYDLSLLHVCNGMDACRFASISGTSVLRAGSGSPRANRRRTLLACRMRGTDGWRS